jgi:hypothetical protein
MKKSRFSLNDKDEALLALVKETDHKILAAWAMDCATRVLPHFEQAFPDDRRPCAALHALQDWIDTGRFSMKIIRTASLDAHAAAREVGADTPARSAARAAGQAVATAHVPTHAIGAAQYALQTIHRASSDPDAVDNLAAERAWQHQHLLLLREASV